MPIPARVISPSVISGWCQLIDKLKFHMRFFKRSATLFCFSMLVFSQGYSQKAADGFFNIKNYGAKGDGHTLDTRGINKAIAACVKAGGGTVYVPAGTFLTGESQLFSIVHHIHSPVTIIIATVINNDYQL